MRYATKFRPTDLIARFWHIYNRFVYIQITLISRLNYRSHNMSQKQLCSTCHRYYIIYVYILYIYWDANYGKVCVQYHIKPHNPLLNVTQPIVLSFYIQQYFSGGTLQLSLFTLIYRYINLYVRVYIVYSIDYLVDYSNSIPILSYLNVNS